jgi:hypothetical protein
MNKLRPVSWVKERYTSAQVSFRDMSIWSKVFLAVTVMEMSVIVAAGIAYMIANGLKSRPSYSAFFLTCMTLFCALVILYFAFDAMLRENEYQLMGCIMAGMILMVRIILQLYESITNIINHNYDVIDVVAHVLHTIVPSVIVVISQFVLLLLFKPTFNSFGWKIYRIVGTSTSMISYFRLYSIYVTIVKVDVVFSLILMLVGVFFVKVDHWYTYITLGASFLLSLVLAPISIVLGCQKEYLSVQILVLLFKLGIPGYVMYKIYDIWDTEERILFPKDTTMNITEIRVILTLYATAAISWRFLLIAVGIAVCLNFRKGLKSVFETAKQQRKRLSDDPTNIENFIVQS